MNSNERSKFLRNKFDNPVKYDVKQIVEAYGKVTEAATLDGARAREIIRDSNQKVAEAIYFDGPHVRRVVINANQNLAAAIQNINKSILDLRNIIDTNQIIETHPNRRKHIYLRNFGVPNGFAYTAYIDIDTQINIIDRHLNKEAVEELIEAELKSGMGDLESRFISRLENGKTLAHLHFKNIFNGNPLLSMHYMASQIEELLKCFHGKPSTNKLKNKKSREDIQKLSTRIEDELKKGFSDSGHDIGLIKECYDKVLISQFYEFVKDSPETFTCVNRHDLLHVYSDQDRFELLDVYKLLLLISSTLDLLEILDIITTDMTEL